MTESIPLPQLDDAEAATSATQLRLERLTARVVAASALPPDMVITVHYVQDDTVNAFATLGGHIIVFEGLWRRLDSENAAAMLLAHEIAHVKNRDPIRSAGGLVLASVVMAALLGDVGKVGDLIALGNQLTALHFSREQESQADGDAEAAVFALYGHLNGSTDLFDRLGDATRDLKQPPAFLSTHPHLEDRIGELRHRAAARGWTFEGEKIPLRAD